MGDSFFPLLLYSVKLCCTSKVFRLVQGRLLRVKHFKSHYELFSFGALCNLIAKTHKLASLKKKLGEVNITIFK